MKPRIQLMREAVAEARNNGLTGRLATWSLKDLSNGIVEAVDTIGKPYREIDSTFFTDVDANSPPLTCVADTQTGQTPSGLIFANSKGCQRVGMSWTARAVVFDRSAQKKAALAVPLFADDAGDRLVSAIEETMTAFFDRHQPA